MKKSKEEIIEDQAEEIERLRKNWDDAMNQLYQCNGDKVTAQILANRALHCLYEIAGLTDIEIEDTTEHARAFLKAHDDSYEARFQLKLL